MRRLMCIMEEIIGEEVVDRKTERKGRMEAFIEFSISITHLQEKHSVGR
jgi:hypothetical protein